MSHPLNPALEAAVKQVYGSQSSPVEPILTTKRLRNGFVNDVTNLVPGVTEDEILQHLVRIRKRGSDRNGLPRKGR